MPDGSRLIVVSNRLPVALVREDNEWKTKRSAGGLATAMDPILKRAGGFWIGWSGSEEEQSPETLEILRRDQACIAVDLPIELLKKFYDGHSNQALWPLFHNFASRLGLRIGKLGSVYRSKSQVLFVEVKPMWANKGTLASELLPGYADGGFVLGIGDDQTDEDLFAQLPENAWSIHVGGGPSRARYSVADTKRVRSLLQRLTT
ncbi:MAG: trehalose-6-phosphate synthase [Acidobacteriaceae bacterium]